MDSYAVGQAPWETGTQTQGQPQSFAVGSAPWEAPTTGDTSSTTPPQIGATDNTLLGNGPSLLKTILQPVFETGKDVAAGSTIGQGISQDVHKSNMAASDSDLHLIKTLVTGRQNAIAEGKDTSHYDNLLKNLQLSNGQTPTDIFPALSKTTEQAAGDILGTATVALSGGTLGPEGAAIKAGLVPTITTGAKIGGAFGTANGVSSAMQNNESTGDVIKSGITSGVTGSVLGAGTGGIIHGVSNAPSILDSLSTAGKNDVQTIADTISPPMSAKEIKLAQSQGRIVKGNEPTLLRGGTPDQILSSDNTTNSAFTINKEIPGAAQMAPADLHVALDARTTEMAQTLQPQMAAVRIQPNTLKSNIEDWNTLKQKQIDNADATEEANVRKIQGQFDTRIKPLLNGDATLDDVWKERISYDNSVPANIKNANSFSDSRLQMKKEMWLQNREILNNIINDPKSGLGATSQQAFKDMKAMYDAKVNLLAKAKSNFEATYQPSKVVQWMKDHPYLTAGAVGTAASATGIPGKILKTVTGL